MQKIWNIDFQYLRRYFGNYWSSPSHINENDVLFHPRLWNISTDMWIDMIIYYGIFICENAVLKYLQIEVTYTFEYLRILDLSFLIFLILIMYIVYLYPIDEYILIQIALFMHLSIIHDFVSRYTKPSNRSSWVFPNLLICSYRRLVQLMRLASSFGCISLFIKYTQVRF